jgi:hypothetical protein
MEFTNDEKTRTGEVLRVLREGNAAQEVSRVLGRFVGVHEASILFSLVCKHANRPDQARVFVACSEALTGDVRGVRTPASETGSPHRPEHEEQRTGEHSDAVQKLSRLLAYYGQAAWMDGSWEDAVPHVATGVANRVDRLRAIGNGQVARVAAAAWRLLGGPIR